jgi:hypothetical protein
VTIRIVRAHGPLLGLALAGCVALLPSAASGGTNVATCGEDQVPAATTAALAGPKSVTGVVAVWSWGTVPCVLDSRLTFAVKRFARQLSPDGAVRSVHGNPAVVHVHALLGPGAVFTAAWRWRNWCGARGRFQLQPNFGQWPYLAAPATVRAPACSRRAASSTLTRVPVALRRCAAGSLRVRPGVRGGFMQSLIVGAGIGLRERESACLLTRAEVEFTLEQQVADQWTTLQAYGNAGRRLLGALLTPGGGDAQAFWAWRNWCARGGPFRTVARVGGRVVVGPSFTDSPVCVDPGSPSTLAPSFGHS